VVPSVRIGVNVFRTTALAWSAPCASAFISLRIALHSADQGFLAAMLSKPALITSSVSLRSVVNSTANLPSSGLLRVPILNTASFTLNEKYGLHTYYQYILLVH